MEIHFQKSSLKHSMTSGACDLAGLHGPTHNLSQKTMPVTLFLPPTGTCLASKCIEAKAYCILSVLSMLRILYIRNILSILSLLVYAMGLGI